MPDRPSRRPNPLQWLWYAYGGGLPRGLAPWVLADTTGRGWVWRHLGRALVQLLPLVTTCLLLVPLSLGYRLAMVAGGLLMGLVFSLAYMVETTEHRVVKAGHPSGTAGRLRTARAEQDRLERSSPYRQDGAGSLD